MSKLWMIGLLVLVTTVQECDKDSTGPDDGVPSELTGDWYASSFTWTNPSNPQQTVDILTYGASFMLQINKDGSYVSTMTEPGDDTPSVGTGTATFSGNTMMVTEDGEAMTFTWVLVNDVLTITNSNESLDFDGDGTEERALLTIVLTRTPPGNTTNVPAEAVGTWIAQSYIYVNTANSTQTFNAISAGAIFSLTIMSNGTYSAVWTDPGSTTPDTDAGRIMFSGNMATAISPEGTTLMAWTVVGNTLTIVFDEPYDFDGDGSDESATVTCVMARQ